MPAFIPTHYTAREARFYDYGETVDQGRLRQKNEAVMQVGDALNGRVKVIDGDGRHAWISQSEIYTGPRRA